MRTKDNIRTGLIVDGLSEYYALPLLIPRISATNQIVGIAKADLQPLSPSGQLAARIRKKVIDALLPREVTKVIVLLDLDERPGCCMDWLNELNAQLTTTCTSLPCSIDLVIKVDRFENWLAADPAAVKSVFSALSAADQRAIRGAADNLQATTILKLAARKSAPNREYHKIDDSKRIMKIADPMAMSRNSRSFRRFLRLLGCAAYRDQSKAAV